MKPKINFLYRTKYTGKTSDSPSLSLVRSTLIDGKIDEQKKWFSLSLNFLTAMYLYKSTRRFITLQHIFVYFINFCAALRYCYTFLWVSKFPLRMDILLLLFRLWGKNALLNFWLWLQFIAAGRHIYFFANESFRRNTNSYLNTKIIIEPFIRIKSRRKSRAKKKVSPQQRNRKKTGKKT